MSFFYPVVGYLPAEKQSPPARPPVLLDLSTSEPIYVNAKQYRGILRRRLHRAKLEALNKVVKRHNKPYLHESRHQHAVKRARGSSGRFLSKAQIQEVNCKLDEQESCTASGSNVTSTSTTTTTSTNDDIYRLADFRLYDFSCLGESRCSEPGLSTSLCYE